MRVRDDVVWREIDGEIVLLDLVGAAYFSVGGSGMTLWPALVEGASLAALSDALARRFALDPSVAEHDVRTFVNALGEQGLLHLERVESTRSPSPESAG